MSDVFTTLAHDQRLNPFEALFRMGLAAHSNLFTLVLFYLLTFDEAIFMQRAA